MLTMECLRTILFVIMVKMVNSSYRKVKDGKKIDESMRYMVYLLRAEKSETLYDAWLCGGAIVSPDFIVTSAACVKDVQYMYAIAGYSKYVNVKDIDKDECTKASKKKIVFVCVPRGYELDYARIEKWAYIDIAVAQVESPYDFNSVLIPGCSWVPNEIKINYNKKYQAPFTDAMVLGWGHTHKYRKPGDPTDYNQQELQYSSIQIMPKPLCKKLYHKYPALLPIIDKYMICAMDEGNLDDKGETIKHQFRYLPDGCPRGTRRVGEECLPSGPSEYQDQEKSPSNDFLDGPGSYEYQDGPTVEKPVRKNPNSYQEEKPLIASPLRTNPNDYPIRYQDSPVRKNPNEYQNKFKSSLAYNSVKTNPNKNPDAPIDIIDEYEYQDKSQNAYNSTSIDPNDNQNPLAFNPEHINPNEYQDSPVRTNPQGQNQNPPDDDDIITFDDIILDSRRSDKKEIKNYSNVVDSRKAGICQNDHGGPLVTWVGKIERLIGIASVFRLDKSFSCIGPYLFTSTQCNGGFLDCVISGYYAEKNDETDYEFTDEPPKPITLKDVNKRPVETDQKETTTTSTTTPSTNEETTTTEETTKTEGTTVTDETTITEETTETEGTTVTDETTTTEETTAMLVTTVTEETTKTEETTTQINDANAPSMNEGYKKSKSEEYYEELAVDAGLRRSDFCNRPPRERGFDVMKKRISWKDHPDGPAANELIDYNFDYYRR